MTGLAIVVDTRQIPPADRAEAVTRVVHETLVPVDIEFAEGVSAVAAGAIHELGDLRNFSVKSNAVTVERTPNQARDDLRPSVFLGMQRSGTSIVVQHGRQALLHPGELVLWDTTAPYTLFDPDGIRHHFFRIPIDRLALPHDVVKRLCAVTLSASHPIADLSVSYFQRLSARLDAFALEDADAVCQPSIELVRALITTHLDPSELSKDAMHATLRLRIMEYLRSHLREPGLSAAQIAAEHHISVRQLYKVLAAGDVSLGDWIRSQRLEGCRRELAHPAARADSIGSVARRWGFTDPSSFARMFRSAFGVSPRQWRDRPQT